MNVPRRSARTSKPTAKYELLLNSLKSRRGGKETDTCPQGDSEWEDLSESGDYAHEEEENLYSKPKQRSAAQGEGLADVIRKLCLDKSDRSRMNTDSQPSQSQTPDATVFLTGPSTKSEAALDVLDYVHLAAPVQIDVAACRGPDEVLSEFYRAKTGARRPKLQDITVSQWGLANARIMDKLFFSNQGCDIRQARLYLAYTAKVHDLFTKFERLSVLEYDRQYRIYQAAHKFDWGVDLPHLDTTTLVAIKPPAMKQQQRVQQDRVCRLYNSIEGCRYGSKCIFTHKCSQCEERHPAFTHQQPATKYSQRPQQKPLEQ